MEESQRQNLVMAFNNVLRTSTLVGVVDLQRSSLAFSALLEQVPEGGAVPLGPLYDFFLEQKAPEPAVREVMVFLKSREARFGVTMELPPKLAGLDPEEQARIVAGFTQRGASSGTFAGKSIDGAGRGKTPSSTTNPVANPEAAKVEAPRPAKRSSSLSQTTKLGIVLGVAVLALAVNFLVSAVTAAPKPTPLVLNDPAGLPCVETIANQGFVLCRIPLAFFQATPKEALDARASVTRSAVKALGYEGLRVFTIEDSKLRLAQ